MDSDTKRRAKKRTKRRDAPGDESPPKERTRERMPVPAHFTVGTMSESGGRGGYRTGGTTGAERSGLLVSWRWMQEHPASFGPVVLAPLLIAAYPLLMSVVPAPSAKWDPTFILMCQVMASVFGIPGVLFSTYAAAVALFDRTKVIVTPETVRVEHGPVPWFGNVRVDARNIEQVYVTSTGPAHWRSTSDGPEPVEERFNLVARLKDGRSATLVANMRSGRAALYLEQAIEGALDITDRRELGALHDPRETEPAYIMSPTVPLE